jgi:3-phosphoinositide dependent protein kinase-1
VGTAEYISPELLEQKMASRQSDIWAIGCIIYQMFCGRPAFRGATEFLTFQKVRKGAVTYPEGFNPVARDLISKILVLNPDERYTTAQIKSNRFFNQIDWDRVQTMKVGKYRKKEKDVLTKSFLLEKAPPFRPYSGKLIFPEDVLREEEERRRFDCSFLRFFFFLKNVCKRLLHEKLVKTWGGFLKSGELIVKIGYVYKRRKLSIKKRMMILTSTPRLIYIDAKKMVLKGEIPLDGEFEIQVRNPTVVFVCLFLKKKNHGSDQE